MAGSRMLQRIGAVSRKIQLRSYGMAILSVAIALGATLLFQSWLHPSTTPLFLLAVMVSAWYGGSGAGLLATGLSTVALNYFFIEPIYSLQILDLKQLTRLSAFFLVAGSISLLNQSRRTALDHAREHLRALQAAMSREQRAVTDAKTATDRMEMALHSINDGFYVLDCDWCFTYVNDRYCEMVSMSPAELLGRNVWELFPAAVDTEAYVQFHRAMREQTPLQFDYLYLPWNCWHDHRIYPSPTGLTVLLADVTDRKQAEAASQERNERFLAALQAVNGIVFEWNLQTGHVYRSEGLFELVGVAAEAAAPTKEWWGDRIHPDDLTRLQVMAEPLIEQGDRYQSEYRVRHEKGHWINVWEQGYLKRNAQGSLIGVVGCTVNVTDRKQVEQALQVSEERLQLAVSAAKLGMWFWDIQQDVLLWTQPCKALFDLPLNDAPITYDDFLNALHPDDRQRTQDAVTRAMQARVDYDIEYRSVWRDGSIHWIAAKGSCIYDETGAPLRMNGVAIDIDERKQAEAEREQLLQREQAARQQAEAAEAKLQQVLTSIREDFVLYDRNWQIAYLNAQAADALGLTPEAALGKNIWHLLPDLVGTELYDRLHQVMRDRIPAQFEYYYPTWDRWFENRTYPSLDGVVNLCTDITDRKRAELNDQFLHQLDAQLRQLTIADQMLWQTMSDLGEYLKVDRCVWHTVNPDADLAIIEQDWRRQDTPSVKGVHSLSSFIAPELLGQYLAGQTVVIHDVITNPYTAPLAANYLQFEAHAMIAAPCLHHGQWVALLVVNTRTPHQWRSDEVALMQQIVARLWSMIEHTRIMQELRQKNAILDIVNESAPSPIFVKDRAGRIIYANPATLEVLGKTAAEVIGCYDCDLYPNVEDADNVMRNDRRIMESGQVEVVEESPDGVRTFLSMKAPYRNETGEVIGLIGIANDITERVQLERDRERLLQQEQVARAAAEHANRIKDEFLAVLSHELRSPLNPILGWSKLLRSRQLNPQKTEHALETIERNAQMQAQLINDLLDMSRILQGKLSLDIQSVDLALVIHAAMETVRLAAEAKAIQIQTQFAANIHAVAGDAGRLQQVIWNLLSNAVKFTPNGGQVEIRLEQAEEGKGGRGDRGDGKEAGDGFSSASPPSPSFPAYAQITITDTGKGIHPDFLPLVFDRFRQENSTITRQFGGLGLGLAIARQIIEMHGGTITVDSPGAGQGATFTVMLPLMGSQASGGGRRKHDDSPLRSPPFPLTGLHILVVDDEVDSREFVAFVLRQAGATVIAAASAFEALRQLEQATLDLIVSDIGMPDMDGYQLLQQVRSQAQTQHIPAIALTAYAGETNQQLAIAAGFQVHLSKPVEPTELVQTARQYGCKEENT